MVVGRGKPPGIAGLQYRLTDRQRQGRVVVLDTRRHPERADGRGAGAEHRGRPIVPDRVHDEERGPSDDRGEDDHGHQAAHHRAPPGRPAATGNQHRTPGVPRVRRRTARPRTSGCRAAAPAMRRPVPEAARSAPWPCQWRTAAAPSAPPVVPVGPGRRPRGCRPSPRSPTRRTPAPAAYGRAGNPEPAASPAARVLTPAGRTPAPAGRIPTPAGRPRRAQAMAPPRAPRGRSRRLGPVEAGGGHRCVTGVQAHLVLLAPEHHSLRGRGPTGVRGAA